MSRLNKLRGKFHRRNAAAEDAPNLVAGLMKQVARTQSDECSCDEAYEVLDKLAEAKARGIDTAEMIPLVHHHLDMCPECREEFEALLRAIGGA